MAGTTKKAENTVQIRPLDIQRFQVRIIGDSPLIVHAWSEKAKRMMLEAQQKTTKTKAKEIRRPFQDFINSMYWLSEKPVGDTDEELEANFVKAVESGNARWGFPITGIKQAANSAAFRLGWVKNQMGLRGAYFLESLDGDYVEIKGSVPDIREDMVRIGQGSADLRYRAEYKGWYADFTVVYNASADITFEQIVNCINAGGFACGIGEWRPEKDGSFGTFHIAKNDELK